MSRSLLPTADNKLTPPLPTLDLEASLLSVLTIHLPLSIYSPLCLSRIVNLNLFTSLPQLISNSHLSTPRLSQLSHLSVCSWCFVRYILYLLDFYYLHLCFLHMVSVSLDLYLISNWIAYYQQLLIGSSSSRDGSRYQDTSDKRIGTWSPNPNRYSSLDQAVLIQILPIYSPKWRAGCQHCGLLQSGEFALWYPHRGLHSRKLSYNKCRPQIQV